VKREKKKCFISSFIVAQTGLSDQVRTALWGGCLGAWG
jgi:hypothetical protein